jgi:hypothetical protein
MPQTTDITEKQFQRQVEQLAKLLGWVYYHTWRSIHSPAGFPDLVLVKPPKIIFLELKTGKNKLSPAQAEWLELLTQCGLTALCVYPDDFDKIVNMLGGNNNGT